MDRSDLRRLTLNLLQWIAAPIALYYTASWLLEHLDPLKQRNDVARKQSAKALQRLQRSLKDAHTRLKDITQHEIVIMSEVITPEELNVKFEGPPPPSAQLPSFSLGHIPLTCTLSSVDIGGLEDIISSVKETVIYPLIYPDLFRSAS